MESPVPVCCICGLLGDQPWLSPEDVLWITRDTYRKTHGKNPGDGALTHTYCPGCFLKVQDRVRTYAEELAGPADPQQPMLHMSGN